MKEPIKTRMSFKDSLGGSDVEEDSWSAAINTDHAPNALCIYEQF